MRHVAKLMAASAFAALLASAAQAQTPKDTIVMAKQIDDIISLDPAEAFEFSGVEVVTNLYDKLINVDLKNNNALIGDLAQSWTVSPDQLTYTFKLRPGVKFHSGNPLTAADVVYSFQRAVTLNKSPGFILTQFGLNKDTVLDKVKAVDDNTVTVTVSKPFAPSFFLNCLTSGVASIVDSKLVKANEKDGDWGNGWLKLASAGSGAYKVRAYRPNEQYALDANEGWYKGAPKTKRIIVRHVAEAASQRLLVEKGDVDIARELSRDQLVAVSNNPNLEFVQGEKGYIFYLGLNQKNQYLAKPEVREALKWLVDYEGIERNIVERRYKQHEAFLPSGFLGAISDKPYKFDLAKAKELLAKAGLPNGFSVTMDVRSINPWTDIAQALQASWAQAGIKLEIIPGDGKQTLTKYRARTHDIYIGEWGPDYLDPHTNAETFAINENNGEDAKSKTLAWRNTWDIPEMTKVTQANVLENDTAKRAAVYGDLQREHQKVSPFVIMFQKIEVSTQRKNVSNWVIGPSSDTNFYAPITKN
ncbi:ABC transporter substrate-binding protein [Bosea sp. (in: a-proteobacteria)]|uniref:ABC transporter substrate-binding protein n=1 Tax=Bosea sp. (in: a-proteobacteria) TaxID=1871050 RepID=UPI002DDD9730|nr:ABC transporter substrate-binding protein [Bosea sp. (in: a-proteobacteria)]HEV2509151.1 ABC transporter substrate-binding protein [Bosea sp. (in: a-proteobacteria)]